MYVNRLMFATVEEERVSEESEYLRHSSILSAKMGIIFNTCKPISCILWLFVSPSVLL